MAKGQFTKLQNNHIESFFPAFVKEMDKGVTGVPLTRWKQTQASNIMDSPLFSTLDLKKNPRKTCLYEPLLFQMIVRKFTNYRNQVYVKSDAKQASLPVSTLKKSNPLLKFSSLMTGRELFAHENNQSIDSAVKQRSLDTGNKNSAAVYQTILKEKWDSLSGEDQAVWNSMAEAEAGDVVKNQEEFASYISLALRELCQGKVLGDAEMLLFYAFREPASGDLMTGTIHGHSVHNQIHFGGKREELELHYGKPWSDFAESVIPRPVLVNPLIPRNSNDQPVFPSIDMNGVAIGDMRMLLSDYFDQCWAHQHSNSSSIPWDEIVLNPAKYYNTAASYFSANLDHPQNLSTVQVVNLVNDLLSTSTMKNLTPFHFLGTEATVLVPETPPITPAVLAVPPPPLLEHPSQQAPVAPVSLDPPPASPLAAEVDERHLVKSRDKSKRQRALDDPDKSADNGSVKRQKSNGQGRGKKSKDLGGPSGRKSRRINNPVGPAPGPPKKKAKSRGWAWVDSDGNEVEDSD
ncbi:hypothetical protein B0H13DRAFT_1897869 [Mycena leptocephala]|nr:hypothetical protein B0H13DRAFT_1897869 [Mycena leptocephala]